MPLAAIGRPDAAGIFGVEIRVVRGAVALARAAKAAAGQITKRKLLVLREEVRDLRLVLCRGKGAGRVDQHATRGQQGRSIF